MTNEEAFEKWFESLNNNDGELLEAYELSEKTWQAAIAYMQEQNKLVEHCCPECGCHFVGEFQFNYKVKQNKSAEHSEPSIQVLSIQENKIIPNATFIGVCEHGYSPPAVGTRLYTAPQRVEASSTGVDTRQLKRLSGEQLDECWEKGKGKFTDVANAIMDAMQELNKP